MKNWQRRHRAVSRLCRVLLLPGAVLMAAPVLPTPFSEGEWTALTDPSLEIAADSPLNFSSITPALPDVRMKIDGERLTFDGKDLPINCATLGPGFSNTSGSGFPDHDVATRYAEQLRRHGYNMVRFHFVDALLMRGSKQDLVFNPEELDRFQFFAAQLRAHGIHWVMDILSSQNAALGNVFPHRWAENRGMLQRIFFEPAALAHWQDLARQLLTTRNPYTGMSFAQDPHTAGLVLVNEPDLDFYMELGNRFKGGPLPPLYKDAYVKSKALAHLPAQLPLSTREDSKEMEDFQRFLVQRQAETLGIMANTIRQLGYDGPYTTFNSWKRYNATPLKRLLPMIDSHSYEHEQVALGVGPGTRMVNLSSFTDLANYLGLAASTRQFGKPFIMTEHDQEFWNQRRFESGLFAPALASIQGWNFICRHADGPIDLAYDGQGVRKDAINPGGVGLDPVARAGETLTALLWSRREIAPAPVQLRLLLNDGEDLHNGGRRQAPRDITALAWVAQLGLAKAGAVANHPGINQSLAPEPTSDRAAPDKSARTASILSALRRTGGIPANNLTDPAQGLWQSPQGQVLLRSSDNALTVSTQFTAARAGDALTSPEVVGPVRMLRSDVPALIAFSSLDALPLSQSTRILVILAADARNSGMKIASDGTAIDLGHLPVEIRRVRFDATLDTDARYRWTLSSLSLAGKVTSSVPLEQEGGTLRMSLDTAMNQTFPTTYFLLSRR